MKRMAVVTMLVCLLSIQGCQREQQSREPAQVVSENFSDSDWHPAAGEQEKEEAEDEYYDAFIHHLGGFVAIFENELYVSYRDPKDHGEHLMMYDLDTKKMQEVGEKELAYQALRSSMNTEYWGKQEASEDE